MTFAIIQTGGKQYKVAEGDIITIEKLPKQAKGDAVTFDEVLLVDNGKDTKVGNPTISGSKVSGEIVDEGKSKKVMVVKYKAKSRYKKTRGHRQPFMKVKINAIA